MTKYSRQRESILENLRGRKDHPTATMVYEDVRKENPNISLGTVYRNLAFLEESGQILRLSSGSGPDHYDGFTQPHVHFFCTKCGKVLDMEWKPEDSLVKKASSGFAGEVEGVSLLFSGRCPECI